MVGEAPLFSSRPDRIDPHLDPAKVDLWLIAIAPSNARWSGSGKRLAKT